MLSVFLIALGQSTDRPPTLEEYLRLSRERPVEVPAPPPAKAPLEPALACVVAETEKARPHPSDLNIIAEAITVKCMALHPEPQEPPSSNPYVQQSLDRLQMESRARQQGILYGAARRLLLSRLIP